MIEKEKREKKIWHSGIPINVFEKAGFLWVGRERANKLIFFWPYHICLHFYHCYSGTAL